MPTVDRGCCDCREEQITRAFLALRNARDLLREEPIPGLAKAFLERAVGLMEEMGYEK